MSHYLNSPKRHFFTLLHQCSVTELLRFSLTPTQECHNSYPIILSLVLNIGPKTNRNPSSYHVQKRPCKKIHLSKTSWGVCLQLIFFGGKDTFFSNTTQHNILCVYLNIGNILIEKYFFFYFYWGIPIMTNF